MTKALTALTLGAMVLLASGCAPHGVIAHGSTRTGQFFGNTGITGTGNDVTIESMSRITKLSIIGSQNEVFVEDGVRLPRIEVFGDDNIISVPAALLVQFNHIGNRNQLIERPRTTTPLVTRRRSTITVVDEPRAFRPVTPAPATPAPESSRRIITLPDSTHSVAPAESESTPMTDEMLEPENGTTETYVDPYGAPDPSEK